VVFLSCSVFSLRLEAGGLTLEDRIQYQSLMERIYLEQRDTAALEAPKAVSVEQPIPREEIHRKIFTRLRMTIALEKIWGQSITESALQTEYRRILENSRDPELLQELFGALDEDSDVIARLLVQPILVRHRLHESYWWDAEIHSTVLQMAEGELLSDDGAGELGGFSGQYTETEWRLVGQGDPRRIEFENGVQIRFLGPQQWEALLTDLGHRWNGDAAPEGAGPGLPLYEFTRLEEGKEYFWSSVILHQDATSLRMGSYTWFKESFSKWWSANEGRFPIEIGEDEQPIRLSPPEHSNQPEITTKDGEVTDDAWYSLNSSDPDTPVAREQHTAVWTGTQMIIWGGTNGTQYFNSGGVYDPATDSWSATSQGAGCPTNRIDHAAIWSRNRMFIWGGWNGTTNYNTGAKYNPVTDTWVAMAVDAETPSARHGHGIFGWPNSFDIWGGRTATSRTQTGAAYFIGDNEWHTLDITPETPSARDEFVTVTDDINYRRVVWGGNSGSANLDDGGMLSNLMWYEISSTGAPAAGFGHSGVPTGAECTDYPEVIIWGGFTPGTTPSHSNSGARYSTIGTGAWMGETSTAGALPSGRYDHTAVMDKARDTMIVWGGDTSSGQTPTGGILDLCTDSWTATNESDPARPSGRSRHTAVWTGKSMLVWGGDRDGTTLGDGGVYTYCWGTLSTGITPGVTDEDRCDPSGIRVSWGHVTDWKDYDVNRRVDILRDGAVIASNLPAGDLSYLDTTATQDQSYDYQVRVRNSCGQEDTTTSASGVDRASAAPTVTVPTTAVDADGCAASSGIDVTWPQDPGGAWGDDGIGDRKYRVWRWRNEFEGWVALGSQIDYGITNYHDVFPALGKYYVKYINGCSDTADTAPTDLIYDEAGAAPTVSQTVTAEDADSCHYSGNTITWPQDPDDWGDSGTGDRFYRVRRSVDGVNFNPIGDNIPYPATSFVDTTANSEQTYHYQVRYKNGCDLSADSGSAVTADTVVPLAPTVSVNSSSADPDKCDDGGIVITWDQDPTTWCDSGAGSRTYDILRDGSPIHSGLAYPATTYTDTTGINGTLYTYQVRYNNKNGLSAATTGSSGNDRPFAPATPLNNTVLDLDVCLGSGVQVSWESDPPGGQWGDGGEGIRVYDVLRDGASIETGIAHGSTNFTDTTGTAGQTYTYAVRYVNGCGLSTATDPGVDIADDEGVAPTLTANSTAVDPDGCVDEGIVITWPQDADDWGDSGNGTRTYDVLRDGNPLQSSITFGTTTFTDATGDNGTGYSYQVRYNNGCGQNSTTVGRNGNDRPIAPNLPPNNTAVDLDPCSGTGVRVTWSADPGGPWGDDGGTHTYEVLRDGVSLQSGIAYGSTEFTDVTGTPGTQYLYTVRYWNCGDLFSETTGATAADGDNSPAAPAEPIVTDASACGQNGVWIRWNQVPGATTYDLRVDGVTVVNDVTGAFLYDPGDTEVHTYEVRARGATCTGEWSAAAVGSDLIDPDAQFCDGFESGDTAAWTATAP